MAKTIYTSVRDVDVRTCDPQPLLRENFLSEFRTSVEKLKVCENLGAVSSDYLRWENILGDDVENSIVLKDYIKKQFEYHQNGYNFQDIKGGLDQIFNFNIPGLKIAVEAQSMRLGKAEEDIDKLDTEVHTLDSRVGGLEQALIGNINIIYNSGREDNFKAPATVGGVKKDTTVSELDGKTFNEILDMLLFPITVRDLIYPTFTVSDYQSYVKAGETVRFVLYYDKNDAGEEHTFKLDDKTITSPHTLQVNETTTFNFICEYSAGDFIKDSNGEDTNKKVSAGELPKSVTITVQEPIYYGEEGRLTEALKENRDYITFSAKKPQIKVPANWSIAIYAEAAGNYLEVELDGWDKKDEGDYTIYTQKNSYSEALNHKIQFK